jgi:hypothetical protein
MRRLPLIAASLLTLVASTANAQQVMVSPPIVGEFSLVAGFLPDPAVVSVLAAGPVDASTLPLTDPTGTPCRGYINPGSPDINLSYTGGSFLRIGARSEIDTTLIVMMPDGTVRCSDDSYGFNPAIDFNNAPAGTYQVWTGTYTMENVAWSEILVSELQDTTPFASTTLTGQNISPVGGDVTPEFFGDSGATTLNYAAEPLYATHSLAVGFMPDPFATAVTAGGTTDAYNTDVRTAEGNFCSGYVAAEQPDVRVNYDGGGFLRFYAASDADTTLIINAADGQWYCNDDEVGLNPGVNFYAAPAGQYDIWVGRLGSSEGAPATLFVTELPYE